MCQVLAVSRSGFYDLLDREPSQKGIENKKLKLEIAKIYWQHSGRYGSPRNNRQLVKKGHNLI